jgi:hypothetical protein
VPVTARAPGIPIGIGKLPSVPSGRNSGLTNVGELLSRSDICEGMLAETRVCRHHGKQSLDKYYTYHLKIGKKLVTKYQCKLCSAIKGKKQRKENAAWYKKYSREWWAKNKKRAKEYHRSSKLERMTYVFAYLQSHPCVDCPEKDPVVLEFDHVRGTKLQNISVMIQTGYSLDTIQKEIDKCEVRCANCHRKKTAHQLGYYKYLDENA